MSVNGQLEMLQWPVMQHVTKFTPMVSTPEQQPGSSVLLALCNEACTRRLRRRNRFGRYHVARLAVHDRHGLREGCRGFAGPIPPPLWMGGIRLHARQRNDASGVPSAPHEMSG